MPKSQIRSYLVSVPANGIKVEVWSGPSSTVTICNSSADKIVLYKNGDFTRHWALVENAGMTFKNATSLHIDNGKYFCGEILFYGMTDEDIGSTPATN